MSKTLKCEFVGFDEYLEGERDVEVRSEYVDGQIYAMAGASELHNTIASEFHTLVNMRLNDECRAWQADMKIVGKNQNDQYFSYYPDIAVACGENTGDPYARTNPILIVEVLSPNTQRTDLKEKFDHYIQIPSLIEYVVVAQDTPYVRLFRRSKHWQAESYYAEDIFILESVGQEIQVKQIYRRVRREVGLDLPFPMLNRLS
jgi:Uma2 family endonuclease